MSESRKVTGVNYFCLGALFIFFGSVLLCALGFTVVLPFETTRQWPTVRCTIINASYDMNVCSCDEPINVFGTCVSKYPCLQVYVEYDFRSEDGTTDQPWRGTSESVPTDHTDSQSKQGGHQLELKDLNRKKKEFSGTRSVPQTNDYSRFRFGTAGVHSTIQYGSITNMADMEEGSDVTVVDEGRDVMNSTADLAILHSEKKFGSFSGDMFSKEFETSPDYLDFNAASDSVLSFVAAADSRSTVAPSRAATTTRRGVPRDETAGVGNRLNRVERDNSSEETLNEEVLRPKQVAMLYRSWDDSFHREVIYEVYSPREADNITVTELQNCIEYKKKS